MRKLATLFLSWTVFLLIFGCGGKSNSSNSVNNSVPPPVTNSASIVVNSGPPELASMGGTVNIPFTSITVCAPGTSTCQTINNVDVDTGSMGLRILASKLSVALPSEVNGNATIAECTQFVDGFVWGPMETADIQIPNTSERATAVPVQVIDDTNFFAAVPQTCSSTGGTNDNSVQRLGAYAILGIGNFRQDCGGACTISNPHNPYYSCVSGTCSQSPVPLSQQVQNPVSLFASDNNGVVVKLPSIPATGASNVNGTLVFGINTQSNNALGSATVLTLDGRAEFTTMFGSPSTAYPRSFVDSGSNAIFFLDSAITGIPACSGSASAFYCPTASGGFVNLAATNQGSNGASSNVTFTVANLNNLSANFFAFNDLAGKFDTRNPAFDWGLSFFYGRNVFVGLEGGTNTLPTGTGQFVAYQ